ncbi:MAG: enoyl-CoA hydratase-related protein, partial [Pseudomonadota bacterium]
MKAEPFGDYVSLARHGRIVEVTYDRGDGLNALSIKGMAEIRDVARLLANDTTSSVIVLQGRGAFSAGADLHDPELREQDSKSLLEQRTALRLGPDM